MNYEKILISIDEILMRELNCDEWAKKNIGIGSGVSGVLLYLANRFEGNFDCFIKNKVQDGINNVIDRCNILSNQPSLLNGISGVAWLIEYLTEKFDQYDYGFNVNTDDHLTKFIEQKELDYEYINGLVGISVYGARRARKDKSNYLYNKIHEKLVEKSIRHSDGYCYWETELTSYLRKSNNLTTDIDLGLAHGNVGAFVSLLNYCSIEEYEEKSKKLIKESYSFYEKIKVEGKYYDYPSSLDDQGVNRLAWCYGDLSLSYNFLRAGFILNDEYIKSEALKTAHKTTVRTLNTSFVVDAPLCHGSVGVALIYNLINEISPSVICQQAEDRWFGELSRAYEERGIDALKFHSNDNVMRLGLLEGLAGIGLAILALKESKKDWLDLILLK